MLNTNNQQLGSFGDFKGREAMERERETERERERDKIERDRERKMANGKNIVAYPSVIWHFASQNHHLFMGKSWNEIFHVL